MTKIIALTLDDNTVTRLTPEIAHERAVTIKDLLEQNSFFVSVSGANDDPGPYRVHISMQDQRLIFDITSESAAQWKMPVLMLPFRRLIKDYFLVCDSYYEAIKTASMQKIEAIDMGRRALHNEGSELLREVIKDFVNVDFDTARRLFTLICVLHIK